MPYYSWEAIDLQGVIQRGKKFARSEKDLDAYLFRNEISLLKAQVISPLFLKKVSAKEKGEFVSNLAQLLQAKVQLHQALTIISNTINHAYLKLIVQDLAQSIYEGLSFSEALAIHNSVFDELAQAIITAGEKTGNLAHVLDLYAQHNQIMLKFKQHTRSALAIPIITLIFFIAIMISIFIFVIPRFEVIFESFKEPLPYVTQIILNISRIMRSSVGLYLLLAVIFGLCTIRILIQKYVSRYFKDNLLFKIPLISNFLILVYRVRFLQIMGIMLTAGVHLVDGLQVAHNTSANCVVQEDIKAILSHIESGKSVSHAIHKSRLFASFEFESLIAIGESSGQLGTMFIKSGELYQKRLYAIIDRLIIYAQPLLLIILGLLIACLIFAIYMPIFTLSSIVG